MISNPSNFTEQILNLCERIATELKAIYNKLKTAVFTVNGVVPDEDGNVTINSVTTAVSATSAVNATNATKATQDSKGNVIVDTYLTKTGKAASATVADSANAVTWGNVSNKPTSFTPSSHNQAANTITAMTGYSKASSVAAIADTDSLNTAIGKIEKALDGKLSTTGTAANASKVNNHTVDSDVPSNAKFTDTVYTHPSTHAASMITGLAAVATSGSYNDLANKPSIPSAYTLPTAASSVLGGVKIGTNISISDGVISVANGSTSTKGVVQLSSATNSTSTSLAATASAVKAAYDLANGKQSPSTTLSGYGITNAYTKTEVDNKVAGIVDSAPEALNTLKELATALGNDANFSTTILNKIGEKASTSELTALSNSTQTQLNSKLSKDEASTTYAKLTGATFTGEVKATAFQATSDRRLKTIVNKLGDIDLSGVEAYSYYFTDDKNQRIRYGVMAQDVKKVLPDAVITGNDKYLSVDYNGLVAVLLNKVNKLEKEVKLLKSKI